MKRLLILLILCCAVTSAFADTQSLHPVAQGVQYIEIHKSLADGKPLAAYIIKVDRASDVSFRTMKGGNQVIGTDSPRTMGEAITTPDDEVVATINGDFYDMAKPFAGLLCGMMIRDGEILCSPSDLPVLGFSSGRNPRASVVTMQATLQSGGKSLPITLVNRPRGADSDLALFTPGYAKSTIATRPATDVIVSDITPALPMRPGVTYTGRVREVRANVTDDVIPMDSIIVSGATAVAGKGETISFSVDFGQDWDQVSQALGGSHILLRDGQFQKLAEDEYLTKRRHCRTALGWNDRFIYVVAIDGRDSGASVGLDMAELASFMKEIGCTDAINLDGGGSTGLAIRGDIVNHPSDGLDRQVSNGLAVVSHAKAGTLASISIYPESASILAGSSMQFRVLGTDINGRPVRTDPQDVKWSLAGIEATTAAADPDTLKREKEAAQVKGTLGSIDNTGLFTAAQVFRHGKITASVGKITSAAYVNVWDKPADLYVVPSKTTVRRGEKVRFSVLANDRSGSPMIADPALVSWKCEGGKISRSGSFTATKAGQAKVTAVVAGVSASAEVEVE